MTLIAASYVALGILHSLITSGFTKTLEWVSLLSYGTLRSSEGPG